MAAEAVAAVEIRGALARLRRGTGLPVAFGGLVESGRPQIRISELSGTATAALSSLAVTSGNGLGGKAVALGRPCAVMDYPSSRHISHEYDVPVAAEGIRSVLAVPVVVRRRVRGVLYGALRSAQPLGDRTLDAAVAAARDVEQALVVRDEVRGLLAAAGPEPAAGSRRGDGAGGWEQVREAHAALRALAPRIADPALRAELLAACGLLTATRPAAGTSLAPRELDVLSWVAAGATNAAVGERLGLRPETVKGYLRSAMRRLGAHTRGEAVTAARRAGLLP
ncbi:helix-turn-helix transcriptional regulator [Streptomyces collinus]|uniref:Response regulator n=1 Tax=Streptomyces collinus (strain DSM 40733 / Tue 365) TaxID=1214242 RepID=S5VPW4_STRC3|nr:helix-turn-helix transcriptional regulator [Streptomyces collinus]AGS72627.1 response regulator [Streptomyces collinus Tu 365]UJA11288.1 LuxR family transcriptional regulator [Streptomyces collinus]UJA13846.1 LuxR family transcriptional regulator [Streptomyces collinus]